MKRPGESPIVGHTGGVAGCPKRGRAAARAAVLAVMVVAIIVMLPTGSALASQTSDVASVSKSLNRLIPAGTLESVASETAANQTFTLFQGLAGQALSPNVIVDVQPYACDLTRGQITTLHAENPHTKVIRYVDTVGAFDTVSTLTDPRTWSLAYARRLNTDAEWRDIWTNHQSWFLKDANGQYIHPPGGTAFEEMNPQRSYLMDPGSAGWRDFLVAKVSQRLSSGFDGVFLDLCSPTPAGYTAIPAKYAGNYGQWRADINGTINYIKSKFPKALVITNSIWQGQSYYANCSPNPIDANSEDGTEIEGFVYGNGSGPTEGQTNWLKEVQIVGKLGDESKTVLARTGQSDADTQSPKKLLAYSVGTFLLGKSGSNAYFGFCSFKAEAGFDIDYVSSVYDLPLGDPTGACYQSGVAYPRDFTNGEVIVNPNDSSQSYTFTPVAPHRYKDQDGNIYDSAHPITLPAKAGMILIALPPVPSITAVTPNNGFTPGADSVIITGKDLTGARKVTFGGTNAAHFKVDSATQITATTPAHTAGTVEVQVTTPGGASTDTGADDFTYAEPGTPTITSLSPNTGSANGGTAVTIAGTYFSGLSGASAVTFDGIDATGYKVVSNTQITAVAPAHEAGTVRVQVTAAGGTTEDTADDEFTYMPPPPVTRYDQTNAYIVKTGTWTDYAKTAACGGSYGRSSTQGATATVWFTGTQIHWIAMEGTTTGTADVYLDGVRVTSINLAANPAKYQQDVYSSPTLPKGLHRLEIVNTSTMNMTLDAVDIVGAISAPRTRYEQTDSHIVKAGSWSDFTKSAASGGSYGRSSTSGASATITFTGTRLDWIAMKGTTTGIADVYLDGDKVATVDLSAATAAYQVMAWSTGGVTNGVHTVKIQLDAGSPSGKNLTLDAVDVWGTLR